MSKVLNGTCSSPSVGFERLFSYCSLRVFAAKRFGPKLSTVIFSLHAGHLPCSLTVLVMQLAHHNCAVHLLHDRGLVKSITLSQMPHS